MSKIRGKEEIRTLALVLLYEQMSILSIKLSFKIVDISEKF